MTATAGRASGRTNALAQLDKHVPTRFIWSLTLSATIVAAIGIGALKGDAQVTVGMIGLSLFIASFAVGVGGTGWLIQGEMFPTAVRGQAAGDRMPVGAF